MIRPLRNLAATILLLLSLGLSAAPLEKPKVTIDVGGQASLFYLPLALADRLGYFRDEGLQVRILDFAGGAVGTITTSFDVWGSRAPCIEIFGTEGTLSVPDPNGFGGVPQLRRMDAEGWSDLPLTHGYADNARGIGPAHRNVTAGLVQAAGAAGLWVHPYTVNEQARMQRLLALGTDGMFTDRPDLLRELLPGAR